MTEFDLAGLLQELLQENGALGVFAVFIWRKLSRIENGMTHVAAKTGMVLDNKGHPVVLQKKVASSGL